MTTTQIGSINRLRVSVLLAVLSPSLTMASGYKINEQSASGVGNAYAGRAAVVEDASVVFYNPAGMAFMERSEISTGLSYIGIDARMTKGQSTTKYGHVIKDNEGGFNDGGDFVPDPTIPFFYALTPINDKWAMGIGVYAPFGASSDYKEGFVGAHFADKTMVQGLEVQPTVSYKFNDDLAAGFGLDILHMTGELSKAVDTRAYRNDKVVNSSDWQTEEYRGYEAHSNVKGEDWGYGFNLSLFWRMTDSTDLGLVYRSAIDLELKGKATMYVPGGSVHPNTASYSAIGPQNVGAEHLEEKAKVAITTPQNVTLSLAHRIDRLTLQTGLTWTEWSKFKSFDVKTDQGGGALSSLAQKSSGTDPGYIIHIPEEWEDVFGFAVGASYQLNDTWLLRSGYAYDQSPIKKQYVTARIPSTDRQWLTAGFKYVITPSASIDFGAAYLFMDRVKLNEYNHRNDGSVVKTDLKTDDGSNQTAAENFKAEYETKAFGLSAQLNWAF
jgi:long-chain fatty acid transport protein